MRISRSVIDHIQKLDRRHFEEIRDSEFRPAFDLPGLKYLRDKAGHERNMRELYRGRAPYELLQNADDAGATQVAYILSEDGVAFAHDGDWFTVDNFRSLADGWSDKDPGECIGHKGIGFRSVLDITPAPHLLRVESHGFFAVKFGWALNHNHIQRALTARPELRSQYNRWQKPGQLVCPIMAIPGLAKEEGLGAGAVLFDDLVHGHYGDDYTTMFWFPAIDTEIDRRTLRDLSPMPLVSDNYGRNTLLDFLRYETSVLLPFLASTERVSLWDGQQRLGEVRLSRAEAGKLGQVTVRVEARDASDTGTYHQMQFRFEIPPQISAMPDTPKAVKAMREARIVLLARLVDGRPGHDGESRFHVYFPTDENTGLGFVVHGDFYVKPDRTRLMEGAYNDWLLGKAAHAIANEFLTELLDSYSPKAVFEALSPSDSAKTNAAQKLLERTSTELQRRTLPFVPVANGVVKQNEAVLPPVADSDGFWHRHFANAPRLRTAEGRAQAFVRSDIDTPKARAFLAMAGVEQLKSQDLLALIEQSGVSKQSGRWWYECYEYLAGERSGLAGRGSSYFTGRKLLPTESGAVVGAPDEGEHIVCLPPAGRASRLTVPSVFSDVFEFLSFSVAQRLAEGIEDVQDWMLTHLHVSRFEATDLLPRAIRSTVSGIYSRETPMNAADLTEAWCFIRAVIASSRVPITSPDFLQDLGRFPVPLEKNSPGMENQQPERANLAPAFLAFWPEEVYGDKSCLYEIEGLRRMAHDFLEDLVSAADASLADWLHFFRLLGVSESPKLLEYRRVAVGGEELAFAPDAPAQSVEPGFTGEHQNDENRAFVQAIADDPAWSSLVAETQLCSHDVPKVLQSMTVLEGLVPCVGKAWNDYQQHVGMWRPRLQLLVQDLAAMHAIGEAQQGSVFCRGGSRSGHPVATRSLVESQLRRHAWLPTTLGPVGVADAFVRLETRHLISLGRQAEPLGDKLLPYIVVDSIDAESQLKRLGVEMLEDTASASSKALIRALRLLGEQLSSEWGMEEIVNVRSRWRLVRGAIQDIYRELNRRDIIPVLPEGTKLAARGRDHTRFEPCPLYYAEPGSPLEQAFAEAVTLIDADRRYQALFDAIGVVPLIAGETVSEELLSADRAQPALPLQNAIVEDLSPYLLAAVLAKSPAAGAVETIVRRIRERFTVKATDALVVEFSLASDPEIGQPVEYPKFYLQRRLEPGPGATREAHFTLYLAGPRDLSLGSPNLDADALGTALSALYVDEMSEELAGLFPRIAARYHHRRGDPDEMADFLYHQLGISREAQDLARAHMSGEATEVSVPRTPPVRVVPQVRRVPAHGLAAPSLVTLIQGHKDNIGDQVAKLGLDELGSVKPGTPKPAQVDKPVAQIEKPGRLAVGPTEEQQARGKQGEEELKRRLEGEDGWAGFSLIRDTREEGCGYDFLCECNGRDAYLEVKTFTRAGYVSVTRLELQVAAREQEAYYLVGVLADDTQPARAWQTSLLRNPITTLLCDGTFRIQAQLQAPASKVFDLEGLLEALDDAGPSADRGQDSG